MARGARIVLGVSGGIAAYKSADLVRRLREREYDVRVVMTAAACEFVTPLTLQAVSGHPVHRDLFDEAAEAAMGHIELARWADRVLVAPASADFMARLAHGLAGDLLATLCLATRAPVILAPAMNREMWAAAATCENRRLLLERGVRMVGPAEGNQACGEVGPGRMVEPALLVERVLALSGEGRLGGLSVLVTAGPTQEPIDPVRFVSNRSSGKMGYAVARAAAEEGAAVTLVSGPTALEPPSGATVVPVASAEDMYAEVMARARAHDIFIAAAAVADYRPLEVASHKIKKGSRAELVLEMRRTPDILAGVAALAERPFTVGFAAETEDLEDNARAKLERKSLDLIAANLVGVPESGFTAEQNALLVLWADGRAELPLAPKPELARALVEVVAERYRVAHPA